MKRIASALFFLLTGLTLFAQTSFYNEIELGGFTVGFCDSLIFCEGEHYAQYGYGGNAPMFLQIWHPLTSPRNRSPLKLNGLRERVLQDDLDLVYRALCQKMDSAFVWYNVQEDFVNYDSIDYGDHSAYDVLDTLKNYQTNSYSFRIAASQDLPVMVYHHGAQGLFDENFVLAEYFASRGFVVVSSNYHLPYESSTYGHSEASENAEIKLAKRVIEFARTLTTTGEVYFIGHSMGAQIGFSFLHESGWADAFVSLETTLEFWDSTKIESMWPKLSSIMRRHEKDYTIPILMLANTRNTERFDFYNGITNATTIHASAKEEFGHESYTSGYLLRYLYKDQFSQPDTLEMRRQLELYAEHLKLIEVFIQSCREGNPLDAMKYEDNFFITKHIPESTKSDN